MTDCLKTIQSGLPEESSKGKYLNKYWDNIPHYMLFDAVMEYILYIKPDDIKGVEVEYSKPMNAKVLLPCANRFNEMLESFIRDVIIENRPTRQDKSDTIKGKLEKAGVISSGACERMVPVIKNLLSYIKSKGETDEIVMLKQIKLGLLLEQDYDESDKATFAFDILNYNIGETAGIIPLNIRNRKDGKDHYKKTQNYQNIVNSKYYVGFRPNFKEGKANYLMNVFYPDSFLDKYYKLSSTFNKKPFLTDEKEIENYEPFAYVLNNIFMRLNFEKNEAKLAEVNKEYIKDHLKTSIDPLVNITDFENCFIGHYMPKKDSENIYSYNDDLLIEIEKEYAKMELEIVEAIKIKYFSHFCEGVRPSRAQVRSKIATRDMRLALMLKWYNIYFNNVLNPDYTSELFDLSYYISENEIFSLISQLVNEGKISPFGDFKKNGDAPKSSFFNKIQKIKDIPTNNLDEFKKIITFLKENISSKIIEKLRGLSVDLRRDLLIYLVNYDTKKLIFYLFKRFGIELVDVSETDSDYYYIELETTKYYTLQDLERDIRFFVKKTEAKRADMFLDTDFYRSQRDRIPSLAAKIYREKIGSFKKPEPEYKPTPEAEPKGEKPVFPQPDAIPQIIYRDSINKNPELYDILTTKINYSMIKTLLVLGYKFLESSFSSSTEKRQILGMIDLLDHTFYNKILVELKLDENKYIKLDTTNTKSIKFEGLDLDVLLNAIFNGFDNNIISKISSMKVKKLYVIFLQAHRYILEGTALEIQRNNTDVPFVDTILGRIRSTVYAFPYRPPPPPLPERKPQLPPLELESEPEPPNDPKGKGKGTEPTRPPRPPRPATRPPPQPPRPQTPPPLPPTGPEDLLNFESLNTIKQALLYLYLNNNTENDPYCPEDKRREIARDYNDRIEYKADRLKVINDFLQDVNGHIEGDNLIIGGRQYTRLEILEEQFAYFTREILTKRRVRADLEDERRLDAEFGPMMDRYRKMIAAEGIEVTEKSLVTKFRFNVRTKIDAIQSNNPEVFDGVFIPICQYSTQCGLHAINNLLQIDKIDCLANPTKCASSSGGRRPGEMMLATDIINTINGVRAFNDHFYAVEWTDFIKVENINDITEISRKFGEYLPDAFKNDDGNAKQLVGLIERIGVAHWVAWLHKGEIWYKIDSIGEAEIDRGGLVKNMRGTLTKYPNPLANEILVNRLKHDTFAVTQLGWKYEHILVFSNKIEGDCNFINRAVATATGGALKTRHSKKVFREARKNIKSKKRLF